MSTVTSCNWQLGPIGIAATTAASGWIARAAAKAIGSIAPFIARRAERRLLRELTELDDRLLDDIGIDRRMFGLGPREVPPQYLR